MSLLIALVPMIIVILIVLAIVGVKTKSEMEGEELLKNVYIYLVLFATLMMSIGGSVGAFMSLADVVSPAPYHESFEEYRQWKMNEHDEAQIKSEEELRASYDAMVTRQYEQTKHQAMNSLLKSFGWIIIPLPVFIYFQRRLGKKE